MAYTPNQLPKYRKQHDIPFKKFASRGNQLVYGDVGVKATVAGIISWRNLEAVRRAIAKHIKKTGRYWNRIRTHYPKTKKGEKVKMGKGTGKLDQYVGIVQPGTIICEAMGMELSKLKNLMLRLSHKIGIKTKIVDRFTFY